MPHFFTTNVDMGVGCWVLKMGQIVSSLENRHFMTSFSVQYFKRSSNDLDYKISCLMISIVKCYRVGIAC